MISFQQARELVQNALDRAYEVPDDSCVIVDSYTIEKPFGWLFFYQSRRFFESGESGYQLAGNGPVFVSRRDGRLEFYGSRPTTEEIVAEIEARYGQ